MADERVFENPWVLVPLRHHDNLPVPLPYDKITSIGRHRTSMVLCRNDPAVSAKHCQITKCDGFSSMEVEDFSTNGTFVNGSRLGRGIRRRLSHGDVLSLTKPMDGTWGQTSDEFTQFRVELAEIVAGVCNAGKRKTIPPATETPNLAIKKELAVSPRFESSKDDNANLADAAARPTIESRESQDQDLRNTYTALLRKFKGLEAKHAVEARRADDAAHALQQRITQVEDLKLQLQSADRQRSIAETEAMDARNAITSLRDEIALFTLGHKKLQDEIEAGCSSHALEEKSIRFVLDYLTRQAELCQGSSLFEQLKTVLDYRNDRSQAADSSFGSIGGYQQEKFNMPTSPQVRPSAQQAPDFRPSPAVVLDAETNAALAPPQPTGQPQKRRKHSRSRHHRS